MKTLIALIIPILFMPPCFAQQDLLPAYPREITYKGEIAYFNGSPFTGVLVDEKTNTRLGEYKNGYRNGLFIENYPNGKKKSEGKYLNGAKDGRHTEWFENGNKKSECNYVNGRRDGLCVEWLINGLKVSEITYNKGNYKDGIQEGRWASSFAEEPKSSDFTTQKHLERGREFVRLQRYSEAIPEFEASLRIDPTQTDPWNEIGALYLRDKRFDEAIDSFARFLNADDLPTTSRARAYFNMGMCYMFKDDFRKAVDVLRTGLAYEPTFEKGLLWLAQSYSQIDSTEQSKATYDRLLIINPNSPEANKMIGVYYLVKKNVDSAVPYLEKATELIPDDEMAHLWLAQSYHSIAKVKEARREYNAVLRINSRNPNAVKGLKLLQ